MYKLVIVEDEENIRNSLENFIPWEEMGFRVVCSFSDGSDALAFLKDNPCDAVMTDILMSRMSGLEMIRQLHQIHPQTKVVILSGHSNFDYAQQAIAYKVAHYLVKPVDEDELIGIFKGLKEQLDEEREEQALAETQTSDLKQMLMKCFFRDLLTGNVTSDSELGVYLKLLELSELDKSCPLFAFEIRDGRQDREDTLSEVALESRLREQFPFVDGDFRCFTIEERADKWRQVVVGLPQLTEKTACNRKLQDATKKLTDILSNTYTFHLTHSVNQISDLLTGAKSAENAEPTDRKMDSDLYNIVFSDYKLLIVELDIASKETLFNVLNRILRGLRGTSVEDARFALKNLYSVIELNYKKRKINVWDITDGGFDSNHLYSADSLESLSECVRKDFAALCNGLKERRHESEHNVIGRIVTYLNENIHEDIGHDAIANMHRIHPGYLSRLFKKEMGETLSEYQLRIKIERAAELLKDGRYKVGEIAVMVGYNASSYFSIMFKKHTGCSPREYSQRIAP